MDYILVTEAARMNALASLRHLADKNRIGSTTIKLKSEPQQTEGTGFYVSMYSSNGINASLINCAEQVYIQAVGGEWFQVKDSAFPNLSVLIGGLYDGQRIENDWNLETAYQETSHRLQGLYSKVLEMEKQQTETAT